ncbi:MAG: polysaccharide biosynthesis tyrosine autokinase [Planctomycetes bacterium]|nr:polysaccharide biosynthesis tyrosine autokinase [Planctomycetota bacterium]
MRLPHPLALVRRRGPLAVLVGTTALAAGIAGIEFVPRPARAAAQVQVTGLRLPADAAAALPGLDPESGPSASLVTSDPVLRIAVVRMGDGWWKGLSSGADEVELAAYGEAKTGEAPKRILAKVSRRVLDAAVDDARGRVAAEHDRATGLVTVTASAWKADAARALADAAAEAFAAYAECEVRERMLQTVELLKERQAATLARLTEVEGKIAKLRPAGIPQELLELRRPDLPTALARLAELQARYSDAEAELRDLSAKINDPNYTFPVDVDEDSTVQACTGEVLRAQARLGELEGRLAKTDPQVKEAQSQLSSWNTQLTAARAAAVSTLSAKARVRAIDQIRSLSERRDATKIEYEALDARVTKERAEWEALIQEKIRATEGANSPELASLTAEASALHAHFTRILSARLAAEFEGGARSKPAAVVAGARDAKPARWPQAATWPAAALAALLLAAAAWRLPRQAGPRLRTEHDLQRALRIPVIGLGPLAVPSQRLLFHIDPRHPFTEAYNTIATLIESYAADHAARTFMVTSASAGEGKSTLVANLAIALARAGQRVVVIDADLRKGNLHEIFGVPNDRGVSEAGLDETGQPVILEVDALLKDTSEPGLKLLSSGPPCANPVALLKGSAFKALLAETQQKADTIFMDVPAVLTAVDPLLLTAMADGIIFVAAAGESKREDVAYAKKLLENTHGRFVGAVLTKATEEARAMPPEEAESRTKPAEGV